MDLKEKRDNLQSSLEKICEFYVSGKIGESEFVSKVCELFDKVTGNTNTGNSITFNNATGIKKGEQYKMGAQTFVVSSEGKTKKEAFKAAVEEALYEQGHSGYTGTIAEKVSFITIGIAETVQEGFDLAHKLLGEDDNGVSDKWGPAGCIEVKNSNTYIFFGWASC